MPSAAAETPAAPPLVWTKLSPPVPRPLVSRPRLLERLSDSAPRRLTLIRAPAGWGKSTLLADWSTADDRRSFAWVALDREDNEPTRFWLYAIEALRTLAPGIGDRSLTLLRAPGTTPVGDVLPVLVHELRELPGDAVLVLDDYHVLAGADVHEGVVFLLEHGPPGFGLVIAARDEPRLPLARLRARGDLLEIDVTALGFTELEAEELLNGLHGLDVAPSDAELLRDRTEGWAAGLHLAALSLRGRSEAHGFIESFAGDDRHVFDFLSAEVLAGQPDDVRAFLLRTSVLDRFSAPLCDAVVGGDEAAKLLGRIERSNLFLVPLDTRREWYRYHHLFRELLRHELALTEEALVPELHRRAAAWLLQAGHVSEAIHHTVAAGDLAEAAELIASHWLVFVNAGERPAVDAWLQALPDETVRGDARLCLASAWASFSAGRLEEVLPWTEVAERAPLPAPIRDGTTSVASGAETLRCSYTLLIGDLTQARHCGLRAMEQEEFPPWYAVAASCYGAACYWLGDVEEALEHLEETVRLGREGMPLVVVFALGYLTLVDAERGDWGALERRIEDAAQLVESCGAHEYWAAGAVHLARGLLLEHHGALEDANAEIGRALELARRGMGPLAVAFALATAARVRQALGDRTGARALLAEARAAIAPCPDPGPVVPRLLDAIARRLARADAIRADDPLSDRELEVLRLMAAGLPQREIGRELYVSVNTVKTHAKHIFRKLGVSTRSEAVAMARERGFL